MHRKVKNYSLVICLFVFVCNGGVAGSPAWCLA